MACGSSVNSQLSEFSMEELADFFIENGVCSEVTENFVRNHVSGKEFVKLTPDDIKELVPIVGYRTKIRDILQTYKKVISIVEFF